MWKRVIGVVAVLGFCAGAAVAGETAIEKDARVYIIWPKDGQVINGGKLWVRMGTRNAGIAPANIKKANTGHQHLLLNTELPPFDQEIPSDKKHLHFGGGQTEARLELPLGQHTLQILFGDHEHVPHNPPVFSNRITITVR